MDPLPFVVFRFGSEEIDLFPGDAIGREPSCAWVVDLPGLRGHHAHVSLRGSGELFLVGERFVVDGQRRERALLCAGQAIELAPHVVLDVVEVHNVRRVWQMNVSGAVPVTLIRPEWSLLRGEPAPLPRMVAGAAAWILVGEAGWRLAVGDQLVEVVEEDRDYRIDGRRMTFERVPVADAAAAHTEVTAPPLRIVCEVASTSFCIHDELVFRLTNETTHDLFRQTARLLLETGEPPRYEEVFARVWGRRRPVAKGTYDKARQRLRQELIDHGLPGDLLSPTGTGRVTLHLRPVDRLEYRP